MPRVVLLISLLMFLGAERTLGVGRADQACDVSYADLSDRLDSDRVGELMARARAGDVSAQSYLAHLLTPHIERIIRGFGERNIHTIENTRQEVLLNIHQAGYRYDPSLDGASTIGTWLFTYTRNAYIGGLSRGKRSREVGVDDLEAYHPPARSAIPWAEAIRREGIEVLRNLIKQLGPAAQEAIRLRFYEQMGPSEMAELLGLNTRAAADQRTHTAKRTLAEWLSERYGIEGLSDLFPDGDQPSLASTSELKVLHLSPNQTDIIRKLFLEGASLDKAEKDLGLSRTILINKKSLVLSKLRAALKTPDLKYESLEFSEASDGSGDILISLDGYSTAVRAVSGHKTFNSANPKRQIKDTITLSEQQIQIIRKKHLAGRTWAEVGAEMGKLPDALAHQINYALVENVKKTLGNDKISIDDIQFLEEPAGPNREARILIYVRGRRAPLLVTTQRQMTLSPFQSGILELRYLQNQGYQQVAEQLNTTRDSVKSNLYRKILPRLRAATGLKEEDLGPEDIRVVSPSNGSGFLEIHVFPRGRTTRPIIVRARITSSRSNNRAVEWESADTPVSAD